MKVQSASFAVLAYSRNFRVDFMPGKVRVWSTHEAMVEYENSDRKWKACETHCKQLVQMAYGTAPTSNQAKRRAKETRPQLRLVSEASDAKEIN